jgi:endonuclease/exonuclease/phosphatase family metal-dependent hydrolase
LAEYVSFPEEDVTLDYMLLKPEYEFVSVRTAENLSDHAAVVFELRKKITASTKELTVI